MNKPKIKLVEHKPSSSDDEKFIDEEYQQNTKKLTGLKIETSSDQKLREDLKEEEIITIKELKSGLEISPTSYIGTVEFSNFVVSVYPKYTMDERNIRKLLDYVWELKPKIKWLDSMVTVEREREQLLLDIVITSLIEQCKLLLKQGLLKTYVIHEENVSFLRGKLLIKNQIQNTIKNNAKFACQFDELEYDNLENQIILAALLESHNITQDVELKRSLRLLVHQFSIFVNKVSISIQDFEKISYNRFNQRYEVLHSLSKLILESVGFRDYTKEKTVKIKPFFINMDDVFEKFVEKLFRFYFGRTNRYNVSAQNTKKVWKSENFNDYKIRTDILVTDKKNSTKKFILDTKYKKNLTPQDRYQIGFYIHEYKQHEGTALLPKFPDMISDEIVSEEQEIQIHVKRIDINEVINVIEKKNGDKLLQLIEPLIHDNMKIKLSNLQNDENGL